MEGQRPGVEHTGTWGRVAEVLGVGGESYVTEELVSHAEELALSPQSRGEPLRDTGRRARRSAAVRRQV